jgi:hypothetical protein
MSPLTETVLGNALSTVSARRSATELIRSLDNGDTAIDVHLWAARHKAVLAG